jgi:WD40 repeat protein
LADSFDTFFSYNSRDHAAVECVAAALSQRGLRVFLDRWYLVAGQPWPLALEQTLASCRAVVVFVGPDGLGPWQQRERDLALDRQASEPGFSVIPALLTRADPALGFLKLNTWVDLSAGAADEVGLNILAAAIRGEPPGPLAQEKIAVARARVCPYRGLRPFREEDEPFFFGRSAFTETLVSTLAHESFVAVIGASGSGKSSVVRAGLIPRLRRGEGGLVWDVITLVPTNRPFASLAAAVVPSLEPDLSEVDRLAEVNKLATHLAEGSIRLRDVAARLLQKQPGTDRLLLFVDQWEEIYTLCPDEPSRRAFVEHLLDAAATAPIKVVLTMRGDFFGRALADRALSDQLQDAVVTIGPMTRDELAETIVKPAEAVGLSFEMGLAETILDDVGHEPGATPLLEFLLEALWKERRRSILHYEAYQRLGRVPGAMAHRAEEVFEKSLSEEERRAAQKLLIRMIRAGEGVEDTRQRAAIPEADPVAEATIRKLADARLVVTEREAATGRETVEVAHEALIRGWQRLRDWVDRDREFLRTRERIASQARLWEEEGRQPDRLLAPGRPLAEGEDVLATRRADLEENLVKYISTSCAAEAARQEATRAAQRRKLLRARLAAAMMLILTSVAVGFAYWWSIERQAARDAAATALTERDRANEARKVALVKQLTAQAELIVNQTASSLPLSMLLAAEAMKRAPSVELDQVLRQGLALLPQPVASIRHEGDVTAIAFSPDGAYLATASRDTTARIWRAANGQEVTRVAHEDEVNGVVFSSDGGSFATCSKDGTVRLWQTVDGREVLRLTNPKPATAITISPDGHFLAAIIDDNTVRVWELPGGREVARLAHDDVVNAIAFRPDSRSIATASGYPSAHMTSGAKLDDNARVWELPSGREILRVAHRHNVWAVAFSSDGRYLATASNDGTAQLWDVDARREVARLTHERPVSSIAFSADGRFLATAEGGFLKVGTGAYAVHVWESPSGREVRRVTHESDVKVVLFSPDTTLLASASADGTARLWDVRGNEIARVVGEARDFSAVTFSPDGTLFATASGGTARVWRTSRPELPRIPFGGNAMVGATFSPDGKYFGAVDSDDAAAVWELSGRSEATRLPHGGAIYSVTFSPDSRLVATAGADRVVRVWDRASGRAISQAAHDDAVDAVAFSPDSSLLATASKDKTARLWNSHDGNQMFRLPHDAPVRIVVFSPDGRFLATAEGDAVRLWEVSTGREAVRLRHDKEVEAIVFSPTGKQLATASGDRSVRVWEAASGRMISSVAHEKQVMAIAFSPDGVHVASAGGSTRIWEAFNGRVIARLTQEDAWRLAFTPDGRYLATAHFDGSARVWDAANGREIARVAHGSSVQQVAFDTDGKLLLTISGEMLSKSGLARVSRWLPTDLIDDVCGRLTHNLSLAEWSQRFEAEPYQATCPYIPGHALDMLKQADAYVVNDQRDLAELGFVAAVQAGARAGNVETDNGVCWVGAIDKFAQIVMPACERAVASADENSRALAKDSRGLARALTGDRHGAVEDFMAFARWAREHERHAQASEREAWIMTLRSGGDPFTAEKLVKLKNE